MVVIAAPLFALSYQPFIAMTTLNSRLQLALINRKKSRNLIEKGFTLVELMIVIVIVGILSAVALPNFLSQTTKAKVSEASTKLSGLLKEGHAEYQYKSNPIAVQAAMADSITSANSAGNFVYAITGTLGANSAVLPMTATGNANDAELSTKVLSGCVNFTTGKVDINTQLGATAPTCL